MAVSIKPSDLYYKYRKNILSRDEPKFRGKPDPTPFDRDDIYEVIPMLEQAMIALERDDQRTLHAVEEIMVRNMPRFIVSRDEVFDFLVGSMREILEEK